MSGGSFLFRCILFFSFVVLAALPTDALRTAFDDVKINRQSQHGNVARLVWQWFLSGICRGDAESCLGQGQPSHHSSKRAKLSSNQCTNTKVGDQQFLDRSSHERIELCNGLIQKKLDGSPIPPKSMQMGRIGDVQQTSGLQNVSPQVYEPEGEPAMRLCETNQPDAGPGPSDPGPGPKI